MDISYWTQLSPKVEYEPTRKQFFDRYLCRLVIYCPAGRLINRSKDISNGLSDRIEWSKDRNWGGSWVAYRPDDLKDARVDQLENLQQIKHEFKDVTKFRVEEPRVQIYSEDEDTLRLIVQKMLPIYNSRITDIQLPADIGQAHLLRQGKILTKPNTKIQYKYKVFLRDGEYGVETKQSLIQYLLNLGDEVKICQSMYEKFMVGHGYLWGSYLYVNDPSVLTFLSVIHPNIVGKIHELTKVE